MTVKTKLLVENEAKRYKFTRRTCKSLTHLMKLHKKIRLKSFHRNTSCVKEVRKLLAWHAPEYVQKADEPRVLDDLQPPSKKKCGRCLMTLRKLLPSFRGLSKTTRDKWKVGEIHDSGYQILECSRMTSVRVEVKG